MNHGTLFTQPEKMVIFPPTVRGVALNHQPRPPSVPRGPGAHLDCLAISYLNLSFSSSLLPSFPPSLPPSLPRLQIMLRPPRPCPIPGQPRRVARAYPQPV